jgi:hypothetical protein
MTVGRYTRSNFIILCERVHPMKALIEVVGDNLKWYVVGPFLRLGILLILRGPKCLF